MSPYLTVIIGIALLTLASSGVLSDLQGVGDGTRLSYGPFMVDYLVWALAAFPVAYVVGAAIAVARPGWLSRNS